jgi:hypothetical protein
MCSGMSPVLLSVVCWDGPIVPVACGDGASAYVRLVGLKSRPAPSP